MVKHFSQESSEQSQDYQGQSVQVDFRRANIILIIIATAIITSIVVILGVVYFIQNSDLGNEKTVQVLQQQINDLENQLSQLQQKNNDKSPDASTQVETEDGIFYRNNNYNFTLEFPFSWKGYETKNRILYYDFGNVENIDFGFKEEPILFNIGFYTSYQWQQAQKLKDLIYLGQNNKYIFAYHESELFADSFGDRWYEIKDIVLTFKLIGDQLLYTSNEVEQLMKLHLHQLDSNITSEQLEEYSVFETIPNSDNTKIAVLYGLDIKKNLECCSKPTGLFIVDELGLLSEHVKLVGALHQMYLDSVNWIDDNTVSYDHVTLDEGGISPVSKILKLN
jgi:hypothetical protein